MSIQATCDSCGRTYSVNEKYIGKRLPCKECGEVFEVHGDEDFESPPSRPRRSAGAARRSAPPARSSKKKGKRRRKSGPNWPLIGIAGGGGLLVVAGLVWALMSLVGTSHESLAKDAISTIEDLGEVLADVKDVPSAEAAVPRIEKIGDRIAKLYEKEQELKKSDPLTKEEDKALKEKYDERLKAAQKRVTDEMKRLSGQRDVLAILQEPMMNIGKKMTEATRAKREQEMAEWNQRIEEARAKAKERAEETRAERAQNPPPPRPQFDPRTGQVTPSAGMPGVTIQMARVANFQAIRQRLQEMAGAPQVFSSSSTSQGHTITIAPVPDLQVFADAVDFGTVSEVNQASRIVTIEADESYIFKPGGKVAVENPKAAEDYVVTDTDVHQKWGEKTAVVRVKGVTSSSDRRFVKVRELVQEARQKADQQKITFHNTARKAGDNDLFLVFGPLENFDKFVAALDFGTVVKTFPDKRLVIFEPDYKKLFPPRTEVTITKNVWPGNGPHGARSVPIAGGEFFAEVGIDESTLEFVVWFYDKNKQPALASHRNPSVEIDRNIANLRLPLQAVPLPGEPEDKSSRFVGSFGQEVLDAKRQSQGVRLNVYLGGKSHQVPL